jgi:hypothetical protein
MIHDRSEPTDHIFICEGWQVFNDMFPFFKALERSNKFFFTDVFHGINQDEQGVFPLSEINKFSSINRKAVIYISLPRHFTKYVQNGGPLHFYKSTKIVRIFHGILGPWANVIRSQPDFLDVIVAASDFDSRIWKQNSNYRVETIGWPKGEYFFRENQVKNSENSRNIIISSNWAIGKADFRICDHIDELSDYKITFTLHPLILSNQSYKSKRRLDSGYIERQLSKLKLCNNVEIVECPHGILPHMQRKNLMLSVISSTSLEWMLFDKPIFFLREHPLLDFGPMIDFSKSILAQIEQLKESNEHYEKRNTLRELISSHFDGKYANRFNDLASQLEYELHYTRIRAAG